MILIRSQLISWEYLSSTIVISIQNFDRVGNKDDEGAIDDDGPKLGDKEDDGANDDDGLMLGPEVGLVIREYLAGMTSSAWPGYCQATAKLSRPYCSFMRACMERICKRGVDKYS